MSKAGMILHKNLRMVFDQLPPEECKKTILDMFDYFYDGVDKRPNDVGWLYIKSMFDEEKVAYQRIVERNRTNGRKGGRPKKSKVQNSEKVVVDGEEITLRYKNKLNV